MTDFQNWWDGYFHEINGQKETAQAAWQARGVLDKALDETQEPVAWQALCKDNHYAYGTAEIDLKGYHSDFWQRPLYTTPPSREWVGLSDEEIAKLTLYSSEYTSDDGFETISLDEKHFARAIEAKLREKNNG